ncbi:MAG: sigma-54-dependent Fis family transcriptional regulator [Deltaproteobacteria bacterium]|nr:sigma-54-dependent Fis family transcriptional regulator [Deltaproteobacteria bacterium]MBW2015560.1 sigma-54-dependent Fis family transcriptional regulator [Deltaproteobacteria bacterium]MBW2127880.1 sigma-54-dependent Fis family transcriptional regulator [Deltaproteobacteria bacterium]MBW2302868.1 sigma-54-dependent Fis family transcriptional regulator [Deltaproteobacteria bacterium]
MARTILIVDDEESILQSLEGILVDEGFDVIRASSGEEALERIEEVLPDLVLLDIWMPDMDGIQTLVRIKKLHPHLQVVMMSGHGNIETAVKATKLGAYDFIEKPLSLDKVLLSINNALDYYRLEEEISLLKERDKNRYRITGESEAIRKLKEQIQIVAPTDAWVLISGENGTGKELVAHTIHRLSKRSRKPMVEVNCAAIPEELIESELFGHEKGAFTGAGAMKKGKFDLAHEGTLFLDEIGDMSLKAQSKTLRILQEQKFERVGGSRTIHVDVRVIAATNKDLEAEIEKGNFREDLYFRLNVIPIKVPPLRERVEDIPQLVEEFLAEIARNTNLKGKVFSGEALEILKKYHWPGNVRELRNLVERLVIMTPDRVIQAKDIPPPFNRQSEGEDGFERGLDAATFKEAKMRFEKAFLEKKLREFNGNISQTAEAIGVERSNLHRKIKAYGLEKGRDS